MSQTFMGYHVMQTWEDMGIWEVFFNTYPVRTLIELGTGHGGLAVFFALQCYQRGIQFHTFDNVRCFEMDEGLGKLLNLPGAFHHINIFGEESYELPYLVSLIQTCPRPVVMLFDDGDKPREWRTFAPHLQAGDFCAVHDYGSEFHESDIGGVSVQAILSDLCNARPYHPRNWYTMWYQRT